MKLYIWVIHGIRVCAGGYGGEGVVVLGWDLVKMGQVSIPDNISYAVALCIDAEFKPL